jgi:hypothetical protein
VSAAPARASTDSDARAAFHAGEVAEKERRYGDALTAYRDVLRIDPGHWFAGAARARIDVLSLYEGSFAELAALDAVRRDPVRANDRAAVDELARLSTNWSGRVWADAQLFVAEARVGRLKEPARGADPALAVARSSADPVQRGAAWDLAYSALRGDLDRASREIADDPTAPEPIRARVRREVRRHRLHRASMATVGGGIGLTAFALGVTIRRGRAAVLRRQLLRPIALAFLVVTPLFASVLAERWEEGMGAHFLPFGVALACVHLFAATWRGGFGDRRRALRILGGIAAAMCVVAAAYLVLERGEAHGTPLLEGFGI